MSLQESNLPEDLQQLMEDWAQEVLIVTQGSCSNSLSISGQQLWEQVVPPKHGLHAGTLDVSLEPAVRFSRLIRCVIEKNKRAQRFTLGLEPGSYFVYTEFIPFLH